MSYIYVWVLHINPLFPPISIQQTQCPRRSSNSREIHTYKLCGLWSQSYVTREITLLYSKQIRQCNAIWHHTRQTRQTRWKRERLPRRRCGSQYKTNESKGHPDIYVNEQSKTTTDSKGQAKTEAQQKHPPGTPHVPMPISYTWYSYIHIKYLVHVYCCTRYWQAKYLVEVGVYSYRYRTCQMYDITISGVVIVSYDIYHRHYLLPNIPAGIYRCRCVCVRVSH